MPGNFLGFQPRHAEKGVEKFSQAHCTEIGAEKGITKVAALNTGGQEGGIHAMLIDSENTVVTDPDKYHCEHALKSLEHLLVINLFLTETADLADIVFPATSYAETDGVQANTERRPSGSFLLRP